MSDANPFEGTSNTLAVDSIDEAGNNSLRTDSEIDEIEIDGYKKKTKLLLSSNNTEINNDNDDKILGAANGLNVLGASNDFEINNDDSLTTLGAEKDSELLGAVNDEPVLGATYNFHTGDTIADIFNRIINAQPGDVIYLNGGTYRQGTYQTVSGRHTIQNVKIFGGSEDDPSQVATFEVGDDGNVFGFRGAQQNGKYTTANGYDLVDVTFENLKSSGRMFEFCSGSLTNVVFNNIETNQQMFFIYGSAYDSTGARNPQPTTLTNVNFTNCKQTYPGDNGVDDGSGQFGVLFGAKLVGCNFINTSSANHGGAFCLSDEYRGGPQEVASSLINCNFINITSRWFAVYIHGNYTETGYYISGPQVLDNCKFINCTGTGEYGGALGISHNNVIIRNCDFINNTGGQGSAVMVGGIDHDHDGFWGLNTQGNNITLDNCNFINNVAKTEGQTSSLCIARWHNVEDGGRTNQTLYRYENGQYIPDQNGEWYWKHDEDLTFNASGNAAAVYVYGNDTKVFNTVFENNKASNDGGAVYIYGWGTHFENSTLHDNSAVNGTVYIEGPNTKVINTNFTDNTANNGAGVYIIGENTYIANSNFNNNTADPDSGVGGAIDVIGDHCTLLTVTCTNNTASRGGAGFIRGNNTKVTNSTFDNNNATFRGGGLNVYGNNFNATDVEVSNNNAGTDGGAIYVRGHNASFEDVTSINNTASRGGSTFVEGDNTKVINGVLDNNRAIFNGTEGSGRGGALDLAGANCQVHDLEVSDNRADGEGGAIYIKSDDLKIYNINSTNNTALLGGSTFIYGENIVVHDCIFDGNNATLRGGGLNIFGNNCTVYNVDVSDNNAGAEGGAVYVRGNNATFYNVTSVNNTASRGGSTFIIGNDTTVYNCTLDNNRALFNGTEESGRGGGLDLAGANCDVHDIDVSNNFATNEGGAIYIKSSDLDIYDIHSVNNSAKRGGAVYIEGNNITISHSVFNDNKAIYNDSEPETSGLGGAVDVVGNDCKFINVTSVNNTAHRGGSTFVRGNNTVVKDCILDNNIADLRGGGINVAGDNCTIENVDVSNNRAGLMGGAIYVNSNGTRLTNITADNNTAQRGGAAFINGTDIIVTGGELNNNRAIYNGSENTGLGGAFDIVGDNILVDGTHSNNNTAYRGGSTFIRGNDVTVQNCNLDNNSADLRGGGINIAGDGCTVENVSVSNNRAGLMGGAIYVNSNGTRLTNITADNNTAQRGGAAFINGTDIIVTGGELNNNRAIYNGSENTGLGGAFDIVGDNILVDGTHSNNNTARLGGSTFIRGSNVTVKNSNLDNNSAELRGGALNIGGGIGSQIINVSASNNEAGTLGGAVYVEGDKALFDNVTSIHNTAVEGGSSYIAGNEVIVRNCNLDNNSATDNGGGLYVSGDNCTFENVALSNCNATQFGGAVYVEGNNDVFDNVTSIHNTAYHGGSSYINGNNTTIMNCNLNNNIAYTGGGVYVDGNDCKFVNVSLSNCIAEENGGAIFTDGNFTSLDNVTSTNNTAGFYGGSSYLSGVNATVNNSKFIDNHALAGGAIDIEGDNATFTNNDILYNDANSGGGVYISGHGSEFSDNQMSYNEANFGGAIYIDGSSSEFTDNNITFNKATSYGGAVYIYGYDDEVTNFTSNNISSNRATRSGGAIYSEDESLNFNQIYAFNNTALKGGFANIISSNDLDVENSTFISNHALGNISDGYGIGGAFIVSGTANATIQGNFYNNTAEFGNGSAIYVEDSTLKVYDTRLYDNLAHSWALPISPKKGTVYRLGEEIIVEIWHIGGDNIANGIHSKDAQSNVTINNITYEFYNHGNRTTKTTDAIDQTPVIGWENSGDGNLVYLDDLEDNQEIFYTITKIGVGEEPDPSDITDIRGSIRLNLTGYSVGRYRIDANYLRTTYYTEISNVTWIIIYDVSEINVTKVWDDYDDYDGIRPDNVTIQLYNDTGLVSEVVLNDTNNWTYVFDNLNITDENDSVINYTIRELPIDGYLTVINGTNGTTAFVTVTNIHVPMTSVNVTKYWDDGNNAWGTRPDNITVYLLADGTRIANATLNRSNNWYHSFENLTVFNGTEKINYTIEEDNVTVNMTNVPAGVRALEYVSVISNSTAYNWTVNNTLITVVDVTKIWIDGNNAWGTRPANITVYLLADGVRVANATLNESNGWYHEFTNLTVFNGNDPIKYSIEELNVTVNMTNVPAGVISVEYVSVVDNSTAYNWTVNNTLVTVVNATKIWNDGNNAWGTRPANITVYLLADGVRVA
ncbi:Cna B-type domain-containing protein, partial [Methanobrevibacter sp.]|uniref:Cna B-type domain-containing protein n=1 Tax=Methanobrevibacter sp. TaxID=66852 RepID=UPI0025F86387